MRIPREVQITLVGGTDSDCRRAYRKLKSATVLDTDDWSRPSMPGSLLILPSEAQEALWFSRSVDMAIAQDIQGIVTGPLSKESFHRAGLDVMGHTGLLASRLGRRVHQGYIGPEMCVVLATDHIAVKDVEAQLTPDRVNDAYRAAKELRALLPAAKRKLPIAVVALNPHAGEDGLISRFDGQLRSMLGSNVVGPLSGDTAFTKQSRQKHSVFLALYHDQGLIPFKMLHGQDTGFQISLGLPFLRTSVDHGTAKDIYGKNKANAGSMAAALKGAIDIAIARSKV